MSAAKLPSFDYKYCMACAACEPACPFGCIEMSAANLDRYRKAYPELAKPDSCTGCGLCAKACPVECIAMEAAVST